MANYGKLWNWSPDEIIVIDNVLEDVDAPDVPLDINPLTADENAAESTTESVQGDYLKRFTPSVTEDDVSAVKQMPRDKADELKHKIKSADPAKIFLPARKSGYICPFCGDGSGSDGDGIKPTAAVDGYVYHCFRSGDCEGDLLRIIATANNLSLKHDFQKVLAVGKKIIENAYNGKFDDITVLPPSGTSSDDEDTNALFYIQYDLFHCSKSAAVIPESERRGLTLDTLNFVQAFWYPNWVHPKFRDSSDYHKPTRRIILPASKERYVAVIAPSDRNNIDVRYKNIHAGKEKYLYNVFDVNVCKPPLKYLIVTEGEIDALSVFQATEHKYWTGATGGAAKFKLILDFVKKRKEFKELADDFTVIILFDADKSGRDNATKAVDALKSAGYAAFDYLIDDSLDANAYLQQYGDAALSNRIDDIIADAKTKLPALRDELTNKPQVKFSTTKNKIPSCPVDLIIPGGYGIDEYCIAFQGKPITSTPVIPTRIFKTYGTGEYLVELAYYTVGNKKWHGGIAVGKEILVDKSKVIQLAKFGVNVNSSSSKNLAVYFSEIIDFWRNNEKLTAVPIYRQTGWYIINGKYIFACDINSSDYLIKRKGWNFDDALTPEGNYDSELEMFNRVADKGGAAARMTLGAALLAPLKRLIKVPNVQLHLYGDRGQGKTPLAKFAVSLFGNPNADDNVKGSPSVSSLQKTFSASLRNLYEFATTFNDLPTFVDELETLSQRRREIELPQLIYDFSLGVGRQIQRQDGTAREVEKYNGTRITTGESPELNDNDKAGAFKRVVQIPCHNLFDNDFAVNLHEHCKEHYGNIGRWWIAKLTAVINDADNLESINTLYKSVLEMIRRHYSKIYEPTHLQSVAACLFAFYLFQNECNLSISLPLTDIILDAAAVIDLLPNKNDMDDTSRALVALRSVVNANKAKFYQIIPTDNSDVKPPYELYGFISDDGGVAFFPHILKRILETELKFSSARKLLIEWKAKNQIKCSNGRGYYYRTRDPSSVKKHNLIDTVYFHAGALMTVNDNYEFDEDEPEETDTDDKESYPF